MIDWSHGFLIEFCSRSDLSIGHFRISAFPPDCIFADVPNVSGDWLIIIASQVFSYKETVFVTYFVSRRIGDLWCELRRLQAEQFSRQAIIVARWVFRLY